MTTDLPGTSVHLIEHWGSDARVIEAARMSTGKGFQGWGPRVMGTPCLPNGEPSGKPREHLPAFLVENWRAKGCPEYQDATNPYRDVKEEPGDERLLKYLWDRAHSSPFEFAGAVFEIKAPICVFREFHRHRTWSYAEVSARYTPLPDENYTPDVARLLTTSTTNRQAQGTGAVLAPENALRWQTELDAVYRHAQEVYDLGLLLGVPKELARLPVPVGRYSRMRATANLLNVLKFLKLRCAPDAQHEIRVVANAIAGIVREVFPRTYEVAKTSLGLP